MDIKEVKNTHIAENSFSSQSSFLRQTQGLAKNKEYLNEELSKINSDTNAPEKVRASKASDIADKIKLIDKEMTRLGMEEAKKKQDELLAKQQSSYNSEGATMEILTVSSIEVRKIHSLRKTKSELEDQISSAQSGAAEQAQQIGIKAAAHTPGRKAEGIAISSGIKTTNSAVHAYRERLKSVANTEQDFAIDKSEQMGENSAIDNENEDIRKLSFTNSINSKLVINGYQAFKKPAGMFENGGVDQRR